MELFSFLNRKERIQKWLLGRTLRKVEKTQTAQLQDINFMRDILLPQMGFADDDMGQYPDFLHVHCGKGIRLWQFPIQYAPYLVLLSYLPIESYLEIGVKHGGSFAMTNAYLRRFKKLERSSGVDLHESVNAQRVFSFFSKSNYLIYDSKSQEFKSYLSQNPSFDLVFIDGDHSEQGVRDDIALMENHGQILVLHDISSEVCPGVGMAWNSLKKNAECWHFEFVDQYEHAPPKPNFMGIGVSVPKNILDVSTLPETLKPFCVSLK